MIDWNHFLRSWAEEVQFVLALVPEEHARNPYISSLKATKQCQRPTPESDIKMAEMRLGSEFPADLKGFYLASNGWTQLGAGDIRILRIDEIDRIDACEKEDLSYIDEFVGTGPRFLIQPSERAFGLVLTNLCQYGFYLANSAKPCDWIYSSIRLGESEDRFACFEDLMRFERDRCLHDLRGYLG